MYRAPYTNKNEAVTISISPVDPSKAFVVSNFWTFLSGEVYGDRGFVSVTLNENSLSLKLEYSRDSGDEFYVDWQVVEYK